MPAGLFQKELILSATINLKYLECSLIIFMNMVLIANNLLFLTEQALETFPLLWVFAFQNKKVFLIPKYFGKK